jgi:hypothetical protein
VEVERHTLIGEEKLDDHTGSGTCIASVMCSRSGIMMEGTLVSMKAYDDKGDLTMGGFVGAFEATVKDIMRKKRERQGWSVINISTCKSIVCRMTFVHANLFYSLPIRSARRRESEGYG